jgi:hypothetical protein
MISLSVNVHACKKAENDEHTCTFVQFHDERIMSGLDESCSSCNAAQMTISGSKL